ncbi:hypothetical protein ACWKWU_02470 [Chitinophaga lutea]
MKPMIYSAIGALLVFSSCSSAYQTAQTPDDVYHSPAKAPTVYASNTGSDTRYSRASANAEETYTDNGDTYVTYDDDEERYDYARRIDNFSRGYRGGYWDGYYFDDFYGPSLSINNYYGYGGWGSYWRPSLSIGIGWGNPWYNSWYSPWYSAWGPYYGYGGWYSPWYNGWYGGGYGHYYPGGGWGYYPGGGWHGGGGYYNPRPSNSWGPRGSSSSRVFNNNRYYNDGSVRPNGSGSAPRRTFSPSTGGDAGGRFSQPSNNNSRTAPRRVFTPSQSERPVSQPSYNGNRQSSQPSYQRTAPTRTFEPSQRSAPERSSTPSRSYTPSNSGSSSGSSGSSAPSRTFRPRGG